MVSKSKIDERLKAVLTEYKILREGNYRRVNIHLQIYSIYLSTLLLFYGLMFMHKLFNLVLILPIFSLELLFRILWEQIFIRMVNEYILTEIEGKKVPILIGTVDNHFQNQERIYSNLWIGFQHFYKEKSPIYKYYKFSLLILFMLFSVIPTIFFIIFTVFLAFLLKYYP